MSTPLTSWLQEGLAAAQAGQVERARTLLLRYVQSDQDNVQVWYWLSRVAGSPAEREICLENVLTLDPAHTAVQADLAALRHERAAAQAALVSKEAIAAAVPRTSEEALFADAAVEPLACPYCAAVTPAQDRQCLFCGRDLWLRKPKSGHHSFYSLVLVLLWFGLAQYTWFGLVGYYFFADLSTAAAASPALSATLIKLAELAGLPGSRLPVLHLPLTPALLAGSAVLASSLVVAGGLYRRLAFFYWLTIGLIVAAFLGLAYQAAAAETFSLLRLVVEGILFLLAMGLAFMAHDEFTWVEERLSAELDWDVDSPSSLFSRGRQYAAQGMWARAAVHWSRAVALNPGHPDYRLALATAYINLGQAGRAREHLQQAQRIEPDSDEIRELLSRVQGQLAS
jgi:tetratricopeptide (TPR) repeat protein